MKGSSFELMEQYSSVTIYFDQYGSLVKKLGIQQVPARVTQVRDVLKVEKLALISNTKEAPPIENAQQRKDLSLDA